MKQSDIKTPYYLIDENLMTKPEQKFCLHKKRFQCIHCIRL